MNRLAYYLLDHVDVEKCKIHTGIKDVNENVKCWFIEEKLKEFNSPEDSLEGKMEAWFRYGKADAFIDLPTCKREILEIEYALGLKISKQQSELFYKNWAKNLAFNLAKLIEQFGGRNGIITSLKKLFPEYTMRVYSDSGIQLNVSPTIWLKEVKKNTENDCLSFFLINAMGTQRFLIQDKWLSKEMLQAILVAVLNENEKIE